MNSTQEKLVKALERVLSCPLPDNFADELRLIGINKAKLCGFDYLAMKLYFRACESDKGVDTLLGIIAENADFSGKKPVIIIDDLDER